MERTQKCSECGGELETGFVPDVSIATPFKTSWHRGEPDEKKRILDFMQYGPDVKYDRSQLIAIQTFRCTQCGLLKMYANPPASA